MAYLRHTQQLRHLSTSRIPSLLPKLWPFYLMNTLSQHPEIKNLPPNFGPDLPSYSTDAHNTYKEQEIEKEEEVLGDF